MSIVVIAEKPSVAADIARCLGATTRNPDAWRGGEYVVTWTVGHLAELAEPGQLDPRWQTWSLDDLPIFPDQLLWVPTPSGQKRLEEIRHILAQPNVEEVVCATDAGREGELIFRVLSNLLHIDKPMSRLWISSLTDTSIQAGFFQRRPLDVFDALADSAQARAATDWLIGMNASRALSLTYDKRYSIGRVQTPTLALVVKRERDIAEHIPSRYQILSIIVSDHQGENELEAIWFRGENPLAENLRRLPRGQPKLVTFSEWLKNKVVVVESRTQERVVDPTPKLHDLASLQQAAYEKYGYSAIRTLELAQILYEKLKVITYPRTDSRYLPDDYKPEILSVLRALDIEFDDSEFNWACINNDGITDHHAIVPTGILLETNTNEDLSNIYELVKKRFVSALSKDSIRLVDTVVLVLEDCEGFWRFVAQGQTFEELGYRAIEPDALVGINKIPDIFVEGYACRVRNSDLVQKELPGPVAYNDATLLSSMLEQNMGTSATRAAIIENLVKRQYLVRRSNNLRATPLGFDLINRAPTVLKSSHLTAQLEKSLLSIEKKEIEVVDYFDELAGAIDQVTEDAIVVRAGESWQEYANIRLWLVDEIDSKKLSLSIIEKLKNNKSVVLVTPSVLASVDVFLDCCGLSFTLLEEGLWILNLSDEQFCLLLTEPQLTTIDQFSAIEANSSLPLLVLNSEISANEVVFLFEKLEKKGEVGVLSLGFSLEGLIFEYVQSKVHERYLVLIDILSKLGAGAGAIFGAYESEKIFLRHWLNEFNIQNEDPIDVTWMSDGDQLPSEEPAWDWVVQLGLPADLRVLYDRLRIVSGRVYETRVLLIADPDEEAVLLHDRWENLYPNSSALRMIYEAICRMGTCNIDDLSKNSGLESNVVQKYLEVLKRLGVVIFDEDKFDVIDDSWQSSYSAYRNYKKQRAEDALTWLQDLSSALQMQAKSQQRCCWIQALQAYFGERKHVCGLCDFCSPSTRLRG